MLPLLLGTLLAAACPVSPVEERLPGVVGPMMGIAPAWIAADGTSSQWQGPTVRMKTLWIFSRKASGPLRITGRQVDGAGRLRFQDGMESQPADALKILDPWTRSVIPGGASAEVMRAYAFLPSYVIYPSPGCWELTVSLGTDISRIVIESR